MLADRLADLSAALRTLKAAGLLKDIYYVEATGDVPLVPCAVLAYDGSENMDPEDEGHTSYTTDERHVVHIIVAHEREAGMVESAHRLDTLTRSFMGALEVTAAGRYRLARRQIVSLTAALSDGRRAVQASLTVAREGRFDTEDPD